MYPEDRVLIAVIKARRDFLFARDESWYRIPQDKMPRGVYHEYIGFFLSGKTFQGQSGSVAYFARRGGVELARRRDLLPNTPNLKRPDKVYYRVSLADFQPKVPPILNESRRSIAFIHTTWDRFVRAKKIADLYNKADYLVDRIYHALRSPTVRVDPIWGGEAQETGYMAGAGVRVICQNGEFAASTVPTPGMIFLDIDRGEDALLAELRARVQQLDGPAMSSLRVEGY